MNAGAPKGSVASRSGATRALVLVLAIVLMTAGLVVQASESARAAETSEITGQVFRDFNSNGTKDTNQAAGVARDVGLAGVTVTGYDANNVNVGTATTTADGSYTLTVTDPFSSSVRVEFTHLPAGYESSFHGTDSGTSVQFVKVGNAPVTKIDFAVNVPEDFSQGVVPVISPLHTAGSRAHTKNAGKASLVSVPWTAQRNDSPASGNYSARTTLATVDQTGSLWGTAFQRKKGTADLFAAATMRRHADLGPLGLGGIYRVAGALKADGTINPTAGTIEQWLDVTTLSGVNVGTMPSTSDRGLGDPTAASKDYDAVAKAGRVGIGGISVSSDNKTLYFVNLNDKKLYAVNIATKTLAGSYDLNLATDERPWALEVHRGKVYVGYVESGEGLATPVGAQTAAIWQSRAATLHMVVRAAPETSLGSLGNDASQVLRSDMGYERGSVWSGAAIPARFKYWHNWVDEWRYTAPSSVEVISDSGASSWSQPILSDLQFTTAGEMVLGFQDRFTLQTGDRNFEPSWGSTTAVHPTMSAGEILIAEAAAGGTFTIENDGHVSGRNSSSGTQLEGPGGREFFDDQNKYDSASTHKEITLGSLTTLPGVDQVVSSAFDPTASFRTSGLSWFSAIDGSIANGYQHTPESAEAATRTGNFAKAGGIGDIQSLASAAPLEIGNRVWFDGDQDGIQDADEPAIGGVGVKLHAANSDGQATGSALLSTTTNSAGEYYFDVDPYSDYVVVFSPPTTGNWVTDDPRFGTVAWEDMSFTTKEATSSTVGSNPDKDGNAPVTTGGAGHNDHTIDAGLTASVPFTVQKLLDLTGNEATEGQEFTINFAVKDFRGQPLTVTPSSTALTVNETSPDISVPVGSSVKLTESNAGDYDAVTVAAAGQIPDADGYYLVLPGTTAFAFTVTNKLPKPGKFTVAKTVDGISDLSKPELAGVEFTVHYAYTGGSGDLVLKKSNNWTLTSPELPKGTVVTLTEPTIAHTPVNITFDTPVWTGGDGPGAAPNSRKLTIGNGTTLSIGLKNPSLELKGGFALTKTVTGSAEELVPDDFEFVAEYSLDDGETWIELDPVTKGERVDGPDDITAGTKVLIREKAPDPIAGMAWAGAAFSGTGVTPADGDEPASFVIDGETDTALDITLTNTTVKYGKFKVIKNVTEDFSLNDAVLAPVEFTVHYEYAGGSGDLVLKKSNSWELESPALPKGTIVTLTEPTIAHTPAHVEFQTPVWAGGDGPGTAPNSRKLTIGEGTTVSIGLRNPSKELVGGFRLTKDVVGTGSALVADDFEFVAEYSLDDGETWIELDPVTKGESVDGPDDIPAGTTVLIREVAPATIAGMEWISAIFSGDDVTPADGEDPASFVIVPGGDTPMAVTLRNRTETPGRFVVQKKVNGDFTLTNPLLAAVEFTVHYVYAGGSGDLVLKQSNGWSAVSPELPDGAVVTLTEPTIAHTPVNVTFDTPAWTGGGGSASAPGAYSVTIGDGTTASITLTNPSTELVGGFELTKQVDGSAAELVTDDFEFVAEYSLDDGETWIELDPVTKGESVDGPDDIPAGTTVLIREKAPDTIAGADWVSAVFSGDGVAPATDDAPASFVIDPEAEEALSVTLTNTADEQGTFAVSKVVSGDFTLANPLLAAVEFTVHYASAAGSGDLVLKKSNGWSAVGPVLPDGTVVTLTEPTITHTPPNVEFETPVWSGGDGAGATPGSRKLTIGTGSTATIGLENPSTEVFGGFGLTKDVVGTGADRVPDDFEFVAEYSLDDGETWVGLDPVTKTDNQVDGPDDVAAGTNVLIREVAPETVNGVNWVSAVFSGAGVTPATEDQPASFVIEADTQLSITLTNSTDRRDGQFTITKHVIGPGASLLKGDPEFTVNWTLDGAEQTPIKVKNGTFFTSVPLIENSIVTFTEVEPSGTLLPGRASWGTPTILIGDTEYANGDEITITEGTTPLKISLNNYADVEPEVKILKGDGDAPKAKIVHEADTVHQGEYYTDGETRDIVIRVLNPGPEPLREVELTDVTRAGGDIVALNWAFPDGSKVAADFDDEKSTWSATWDATFDPGTTRWAVGDYIVGTAKLTVNAPAGSHQDVVKVDAVGALSGKPVEDDNPYNSFTAGIQVIKYDGNKADPAIKDADGNWITPTKPMNDAMQDANDVKHSVPYVANKKNKVRWVVTNTGPTTLTHLTLKDLTGDGPDIGADWTADLSAFGGPSDFSFVKEGAWEGLLPPGASFFAEGTLTLPKDMTHQDTVTVTGVPVIPDENEDGTPSDRPWLDEDGTPHLVRDADGNPVVLTDDDPFNAHTPSDVPPEIEYHEHALPDAGSGMGPMAPLGGLLLLLTGVGVVALSMRRSRESM